MVWRTCERLNIRPPAIGECWEDNLVEMQAELLAYNEIRTIEENNRDELFLKGMGAIK